MVFAYFLASCLTLIGLECARKIIVQTLLVDSINVVSVPGTKEHACDTSIRQKLRNIGTSAAVILVALVLIAIALDNNTATGIGVAPSFLFFAIIISFLPFTTIIIIVNIIGIVDVIVISAFLRIICPSHQHLSFSLACRCIRQDVATKM